VPINSTIPSPLKGMPYQIVDATRTLDEMSKWGRLYDDIVIKAGRK
jgi:iron(III) transport system substrate-binding protein